MDIIEINALPNGAHRNQSGFIGDVPAGWAVVPEGMDTPNFPFGDIEVDESKKPPVVTKWTARDIPAHDPEEEHSEADDTAAMLVDHEYRLTLLELGLTE